MSEFSLTSVFVVPVGNTLPTVAGTQNLTAGKFGVFKDDAGTIATAGNISTASYIQFFQGREATIAAVTGTKRSDKIKAISVKNFYKVTGSSTANVQITTVGAFNETCGQDLTLTLVAHSSYLDTISFNGLTRSITVKTPCCACGAAPCTTIDNEAMVDLIIAKLASYNNAQVGTRVLNINTFFTFTKVGTGTGAVLTITGNPLTVYAQPCDVAANPLEFDRMWFRAFVYNGAPTAVDFYAPDACNVVGTVTVTQRSGFPHLTSNEVAQMEIDYFSYQSPAKHLFKVAGYNNFFESYVTAGTVYTQYVILFNEGFQNNDWSRNSPEDEKVIIYMSPSEVTAFEAAIAPYLGAPVDKTWTPVTSSPLNP